jgi:isochorismate hydrolase
VAYVRDSSNIRHDVAEDWLATAMSRAVVSAHEMQYYFQCLLQLRDAGLRLKIVEDIADMREHYWRQELGELEALNLQTKDTRLQFNNLLQMQGSRRVRAVENQRSVKASSVSSSDDEYGMYNGKPIQSYFLTEYNPSYDLRKRKGLSLDSSDSSSSSVG